MRGTMMNPKATGSPHARTLTRAAAGGRHVALATGGIALTVLLYAAAVWLGEVNQDEGWYLYAGRLVAEGRRPFVDFASTQGPVMAYAYAAAYPLVAACGLLGGRLFTAALGLLATLLTARLALLLYRQTAARAGAADPPPTASHRVREATLPVVITLALLGGSLYHAYFTSMVKTYALTAVLTVGGLLCLAGTETARRPVRTALLALAAGLCFAAAAGVRLSAGVMLPVAGLWLLARVLTRSAATSPPPGMAGLNDMPGATLTAFVGGGVLGLSVVFAPFLIEAPHAVRFGLLDYHTARAVGGTATRLVHRGGFLIRLAGAYFPMLAAGGLCVVAGGWRPDGSAPPTHRLRRFGASLPGLLIAAFGAIALVHLAAPFPYDDYQVFAMPLPTAVVVARLTALLTPRVARARTAALAALLLLAAVHAAASPLLQSWLLAPRDRIWWPLKTESSLATLRRAARAVQACPAGDGAPADLLLTQDLYLAVESGRHVPAGMELGPFCYFPALTDAQAEQYRVLNRTAMERLLRTCPAPVAAFSGYGFAIRAPAIAALAVDEQARLWAILEARYVETTTIAQFGQASTTLRIFAARNPAGMSMP
jgi:hypothetical protein